MSPTIIASDEQIDTAVGLPIAWYFDPEIFEIERRALFSMGPIYSGHVSQIPADGDYVVLGGQQTGNVLVRHEGRPRLLSNVCRHRQTQLLSGRGHTKNIVCPLHNWAYNLDGEQLAAPHFAENPGLNLPKTDLTEWNGFLFAGPRNIRRELSSLQDWTAIRNCDVVLQRVDDEEYDLNWKAFLDVYLEDYHISAVHPGFRAFIDASEIKDGVQFAAGDRSFCERISVRWPFAAAGSPLFAEYQKVLLDVSLGGRPEFAAVWLCLFSGQLIEWYPHCVVVTTYVPLSPTRTRLRSEYFFDREIAESRRDYVEISLAVLDEVTSEDQQAAEALQHGRRILYDRGQEAQGPYQIPMEQGLRRFHDCLRRVIEAAS